MGTIHSPPNTPETRNIGSFLKQTPRARPGPKTGPHAPRPKEKFSVCLKQIAAIKLLMLWQPNTHEHKRYHRFAKPRVHRQLQGIPLMCATALGADFSGYVLGPSPQEATGSYKGSYRTIR